MNFDNNKWVTNILKVVDTLNTLNGGIISPVFKLDEFEDHYELLAKIPGISPENLRVEIIENKIMIYHLMEVGNEQTEIVPNILKVNPVPSEVDLSKISAEFDDKLLVIHMPLGQAADGYFRSVNIDLNS